LSLVVLPRSGAVLHALWNLYVAFSRRAIREGGWCKVCYVQCADATAKSTNLNH
jgi:hypothetical protein